MYKVCNSDMPRRLVGRSVSVTRPSYAFLIYSELELTSTGYTSTSTSASAGASAGDRHSGIPRGRAHRRKHKVPCPWPVQCALCVHIPFGGLRAAGTMSIRNCGSGSGWGIRFRPGGTPSGTGAGLGQGFVRGHKRGGALGVLGGF